MTPERTCPPVPESRKLERGGAVRASGRAERLTASARAAVRGDVAPSNAGGGAICGRLRWRTEQGPPGQNRAPQNNAGVRRPPHAPPPGPGRLTSCRSPRPPVPRDGVVSERELSVVIQAAVPRLSGLRQKQTSVTRRAPTSRGFKRGFVLGVSSGQSQAVSWVTVTQRRGWGRRI